MKYRFGKGMGVKLTTCMDAAGSFIFMENSRCPNKVSENQHDQEDVC